MALQGGFVVGYALTEKKTKSFIQPKLLELARSKGITLLPIDSNKPLLEQGSFDVILHKLARPEWQSDLEAYQQVHKDVIVVDQPEAIRQLRNRQSMLQGVASLNLTGCGGSVGIPKQLVVTGDPEVIPQLVAKAGLKLPLVAKPLVADGTADSHLMSLAYDEDSLSQLRAPLVLQEFVNHGGVLFKVYVVGEFITTVRRLSLPDVNINTSSLNGVRPFARVSSAAAFDAEFDAMIGAAAEAPPDSLLTSLSAELRRRLGLNLFNLDIIREKGTEDNYYVIDINYFPGYGKMPEYEHVIVGFLLSLAKRKGKLSEALSPTEDASAGGAA